MTTLTTPKRQSAEFPTHLALWLKRMGLTPYACGKRGILGVGQATIGKWLRGQGPGNEPGIRALMDAYARGLMRDTGKSRDERIAGAEWINDDEARRVLKHLKGNGNG